MFNKKTNEITYENVVCINSLCLFEGEPFAILDEGRIKSALGNQYQPYSYDELAFASVYKSLVINHGFANGNKRTAAIVLYIASKMLNNDLKINDQQFADLTYRIAGEGGSRIEVEDIANEVFSKDFSSRETFAQLDIEETTKTFIENHKWLMEKLGE